MEDYEILPSTQDDVFFMVCSIGHIYTYFYFYVTCQLLIGILYKEK